MDKLNVKRALLSVYYKDGLVKLAQFLQSMDVEIISTGGTYKTLAESSIKCIPIEEFTGTKEFSAEE